MLQAFIQLTYLLKKYSIALKAEVDKLDIKLTNVSTSLNNLKTKVHDLWQIMLCNVVDNEVIKSKKFTTLKAKVNSLEKKIPDASTLIYINQYNSDSRNGDIDKEIPDTSCLVTTTF